MARSTVGSPANSSAGLRPPGPIGASGDGRVNVTTMTSPTAWNWADVFETIAATTPDAPAQVCGERRFSWADFDRRADNLAADMLAAGIGEQGKVAAYLTNCPEYLETYYAAFKAGLAPVNTNFRYGPEEIRYLFDNADAEAVVFHASYGTLIEQIRGDLPHVKRWYVVDDPEPTSATRPDWAIPYEEVVGAPRSSAEPTKGPWGRSGDHLLLLYTGGTTGMPKGVMWRQDDLFNVLGSGGNALLGRPPVDSLSALASQTKNPPSPAPILLPACPLMHGTGQFSAMICLAMGGSVVTNPLRTFDPAQLLSMVESEKVTQVVIVGDAFARPILAALEANPGGWDLSSLRVISSSGVMWSQEIKDGMLEHLPDVILFDSFGSSEAVGLGASVSTKGNAEKTAKFSLGPTVHVFDDDNVRVNAGDERIGFVAISGFVPMGYYKDPEKTAKTFRVIDGVRYSVPGDYAAGNRGGHPAPARTRLGVHQHGRREGVPGGGGGNREVARLHQRRSVRGYPRRPLRRGDLRGGGTIQRSVDRRRRDYRARPVTVGSVQITTPYRDHRHDW